MPEESFTFTDDEVNLLLLALAESEHRLAGSLTQKSLSEMVRQPKLS